MIMIIYNSLVFYSVLQALIIASTPPAFIAVLSQARLIADAQQQERDQDAWPWIKRMRFGKRNYLCELTYPLKGIFESMFFHFPRCDNFSSLCVFVMFLAREKYGNFFWGKAHFDLSRVFANLKY